MISAGGEEQHPDKIYVSIEELQRQMRRMSEETDRRREVVLAEYRAMTPKVLKQKLLAEYRCRKKGCVLLHVWNTPTGRKYYQRAYGLPSSVAEAESVESARQTRTTDGYRKWVERAGAFDALLNFLVAAEDAGGGLDLRCDHVLEYVTGKRLANSVDVATPGSPTEVFLPSDTTRDDNGSFE